MILVLRSGAVITQLHHGTALPLHHAAEMLQLRSEKNDFHLDNLTGLNAMISGENWARMHSGMDAMGNPAAMTVVNPSGAPQEDKKLRTT